MKKIYLSPLVSLGIILVVSVGATMLILRSIHTIETKAPTALSASTDSF